MEAKRLYKFRRGWKTYIIRGDLTRLYKIGRAMNPVARFKELQIYNAEPLTLVATIDTDFEMRLHTEFAAFRHHNEWFKETPQLLRFIELYSYTPPVENS